MAERTEPFREWLSAAEAAERLRVPARTVRYRCQHGQIPAIRQEINRTPQWQIHVSVVEALAAGAERPVQAPAEASSTEETGTGGGSAERAEEQGVPWPVVEGTRDDQLAYLHLELAEQRQRHKSLEAMLRAKMADSDAPVDWPDAAEPAELVAIDDDVSRVTALIRWHQRRADTLGRMLAAAMGSPAKER